MASTEPMRPAMAVHVVPPGSIVILTGVQLETNALAAELVKEITGAVGHGAFALLVLGEGAVDVWGPDDDLAAKVAALFPRDVRLDRHTTPQVTAPDDVQPGGVGHPPIAPDRPREGGIPTARTTYPGEEL